MNKKNKSKRVYIRVTEDELNKLKDKGKNYPTLSFFIIDACMKFDDGLGIMRLKKIQGWTKDYLVYRSEINRIGNNLNQISHYLNKLQSTGVIVPDSISEIKHVQDDLSSLFKSILKSNMNFEKMVKKL